MVDLSTYFNKERQVLVVDDVSSVQRIVCKLLGECGVKDIITAENGKEALEYLAQGNVSLIISDWNMPVMTGLELLEQVRSSEHKHVPFIMITASSQKDSVLKAAQAGVTDYITKPFNKEILEQKVVSSITKAVQPEQIED